MSFTVQSRTLSHVAIIGSGQIGPDIALHFAKVLAPFGGRVTVVDVQEPALAAGKARTWKKIDKGADSGAWKPAEALAMQAALIFTNDYNAVADADLVVEAATEDEALKGRIFTQLEALCRPDAVFLSNSSHLEPERIFATLQHKGRTAVAHYFFPAERNPVVEIVSGADTTPELSAWLLRFYEAIGKVPLAVRSRYGYAADPIFEGVFEAACLAVEAGLGTVKEVDFVARAALGMSVGPFTAMNLTGGNPITQHGLNLMNERLGRWFRSPRLLDDQLGQHGPTGAWPVAARGELVQVEPMRAKSITETLRGAYLGLTFGLVDSGIISLGDFELCIEMALDMHGPCHLANKLGVSVALELVEQYCKDHPDLPVPQALREQADKGLPFAPSNLVIEDMTVSRPEVQGTATVRVIRVRRPKVLNALNHDTYHQIAQALADVTAAPQVLGAVLSGFGTKAFVSGADIQALHAVRTPEEGYAIAKLAQDVARHIETMEKPVVAALNGLAFGGGLELAMACHARVGSEGLKVLAALPEVNLGIIPAAGGTQRLVRLVGLAQGQVMLRTGAPVGSDQALAIGLVTELAPAGEVLEAAANLAMRIADGTVVLAGMPEEPMWDYEPELEPVDIGHRSRRVDELLCESIVFGVQHRLEEGLANELEVFKEICQLQDMRIGVEHFVKSGVKSPAPFVHA